MAIVRFKNNKYFCRFDGTEFVVRDCATRCRWKYGPSRLTITNVAIFLFLGKKGKFRCLFAALLVMLLAQTGLHAQTVGRRGPKKVFSTAVEKKRKVLDSAEIAFRDSMKVVDSLHRIDSVDMLGKSSLELPAFSEASDSIVESFSGGHRKIFYYGNVTVKYQDMQLTAAYMEYDMNSGTVYAKGVYDSLTGEWVGRPVMTQGPKTYNMEEVKYNFNTKKSAIRNMVTTEDDGILHGQTIKMMPDQSINMKHGKYTVCDLDHPHYWLELSCAKVITEPSQKTVFGPSHIVVEDVHIPFVGLPFGFIPKRPQRATGLLMPTFGEETARGFYMRDAGMYFVFGDYLDLSVTGDYFTLGSWAVNVNSRYMAKYKFTGNFGFNYSYDKTGEKGTSTFEEMKNIGLKWSHQQDSKAHPGSTFSASVNFSSPKNSRYNSRSVSEALQNQTSSSISYSRNWNGKFNLSVNGLHSQSSRDSSYSFTLPNVTFSISTFYPFKLKHRVGKEKFYEKFSIGYSTSLQNKINFKASEFGQEGFLDKFQNGMTHNFSLGLPNFQLLKYISVNPSLSYGMNWHFRQMNYQYNPDTDQVEGKQGKQFGTFGVTQTYSGSISMSTRIYGTFNFGQYRKVQAIRHVISPSLSMSFSPELGTYANGYRTLYYTDKNGQDKEYQYNLYTGNLYSPPGTGKSASASIQIGNNLEAKVRDFADTTGKASKKVKLLDQLNFGTSYNFLADSLRMQQISMSVSTNLFNQVNISGSASLDPYAMAVNGTSTTRVNKMALSMGQGLFRMPSASISASWSISGKGEVKGNDGNKDPNNPSNLKGGEGGGGVQGAAQYYQRIYYHPVTGAYVPGGWLYYTNPNVPWSLNFNYSFSYNRQYKVEEGRLAWDNRFTQTLGLSGNIKLTPKMSINATTGFDIMALKLTTTQFSATYDLHCFNISVSWVPTGAWKQYSFCIAANASQLADLLRYRKSSSQWDN